MIDAHTAAVDFGIGTAVLVVVWIVCYFYKRTSWIYGAPSVAPPKRPIPVPPGEQQPLELDAYHIAYLKDSRDYPGAVTVLPLVGDGTVRLNDGRATPGPRHANLNSYEEAALALSRGVPPAAVANGLSGQLAPTLARQLEGSRVQCPEGARGLPHAASCALWMGTIGVGIAIVGVCGASGLLSIMVVTAAWGADLSHHFSSTVSLSEAGSKVCREIEWKLDRRCDRRDGPDYPRTDVALYLALKRFTEHSPPKPGTFFHHLAGPADNAYLDTTLGPKLTAEERNAARRTNRWRKALVLTLGLTVLVSGVLASLAYGFREALWIHGLNGALMLGTLTLAAFDYRYYRRTSKAELLKPFLPHDVSLSKQ